MKYLIILLALTLFGCSVEEKRTIQFFNGISFEIRNSESLGEVNEHSNLSYASCIDSLGVQIPLFKVVNGNQYTIYLGIPVDTSLEDIIKKSQSRFEISKTIETDSLTYCYFKVNNNKQHLCVLTRKTENSMVFLIAESPSKQVLDSLFNKQSFINRLKHP